MNEDPRWRQIRRDRRGVLVLVAGVGALLVMCDFAISAFLEAGSSPRLNSPDGSHGIRIVSPWFGPRELWAVSFESRERVKLFEPLPEGSIEIGWESDCDATVVVDSPERQKRGNLPPGYFENRERAAGKHAFASGELSWRVVERVWLH